MRKNLFTKETPLTAAESEDAFAELLHGGMPAQDMAAFLSLLHKRGETEAEVLGAARALRRAMTPFEGAADALDVVGTGGDGHGTYNISSAVIFVLAGAGIKIAKHGNRAVSSKSGASDVLGQLGIRVDVPATVMRKALDEANAAFLMAPLYHTAMKHVAPVRAALGHRTIFNLLGPLTNPGHVKKHLIGVYDRKWLLPFVRVLQALGSRAALVVHGRDGMDEITTTALTDCAALKDNQIETRALSPEDAGLSFTTLTSLQGGDAAANAAALKRLLEGEKGPYRDIVLLNAAAGFTLAGRAASLHEGVALGAESLDSGKAKDVLEKLTTLTNAG
jgi:anthranilate phosphoribosyltransferase